MKIIKRIISIVSLLMIFNSLCLPQSTSSDSARFIPLGMGTVAYDISSDGTTVIGGSQSGPFKWTEATGVVLLPNYPGATGTQPAGVSGDGSVICGNATGVSGINMQPLLWIGSSISPLPLLSSVNPASWTAKVSYDGTKVVGRAFNDDLQYRAVMWSNGSIINLGAPSGMSSAAYDISADGSVIVGTDKVDATTLHAVRSINGGPLQSLGTGGSLGSLANGVSNNGEVIVGALSFSNGTQAAKWTASGGWEVLQGTAGISSALAISDNGKVIVGRMNTFNTAFVWDESNGARDLKAVLENEYNLNLAGWNLTQAYSVDSTGSRIVGVGTFNGIAQAWLVQLPTFQITEPEPGELWIAGETDTIKWTGGPDTVDILISTDYHNGSGTFRSIVQNYTANSRSYIWQIPDTILSRKCVLKIQKASDTSANVESSIFRIKPYVLTRINALDSNYYEFRKNRDQWGFWNDSTDMWPFTWYQQFNYNSIDPFTNNPYSQSQAGGAFTTARSAQHPDWISWVNAFTVNSCYHSIPSAIYKANAVLKWKANAKSWGGSCFGIAIANALAFQDKDAFRTTYHLFPFFNNPINVTSNNGVKSTINDLFTHQLGNPHLNYRATIGLNKTPKQTLLEMLNMFTQDNAQVRTLSFNHNTGSGGHAILAYGLQKDTLNPNIFYIKVYDNSFPNSNIRIVVDTSANGGTGSWNYSNWPGWGGSGKFYLRDSVVGYLNNPTISKVGYQNSPFILDDELLQVYNPVTASVRIIDSSGNITGYFNNTVVDEIPNSIPIIVDNGSETPPYGYTLTNDSYSVILNQFQEDTAEVFFFTGNKSFLYERYNVQETQTDRLFYDEGISASNHDAQVKKIKLLNLISEAAQEKLFLLRSLELAQNDSVKIENPDSNIIKLISYGSSKEYDIELNYINGNGIGRFEKFNLTLPSNTSHTFVPDWENIENSLLQILVDEGNNGTIDDTLEVANQTGATTFQLAVAVNEGWNMVSVPGLHPVDQNIDTWWAERDPSAGVFNFNNGYNQVTTVAPGAGYWMKHSTADTLSTGDEWPAEGIQIVAHDPINGLAGWNLIGAFEQIVSVNSITTNPPGLQQGSVFGYSSGYSEATQLVPGYGYWIKLSAPGEIIIPNTALIGNRSKTKTNRDSWGKIILTDASGKSYTLYAVNENINLSEYDLPPLPPSEIFDVRYGSNRFAENLQGLTHSIIMQGLDYPVTAKAEAVTILLRDETGQKLNAVLNSGDQVVISDLSKIFISGNVLPVKFALEQNYPNPFNPITKIKYAIPQNSLVILTVYDILGSEVAKLVNEEKPSGSYEVEFDASIYSSGIYFYRLQAGNFAETKKMILLK